MLFYLCPYSFRRFDHPDAGTSGPVITTPKRSAVPLCANSADRSGKKANTTLPCTEALSVKRAKPTDR